MYLTTNLINADVNGALNIMRKYFQSLSKDLSVACDFLIREITGSGLVFQPVRVYVHPYKPSRKGSPVYITK